VGADRLFFVGSNPVIVFAEAPSCDPEVIRRRFRDIWNMARPQLLFLASPGQLEVYDLAKGPARDGEEWKRTRGQRRLEVVGEAKDVAVKLERFRRERIETGRFFEEARFGDEHRADQALIADLRAVRRELRGIEKLEPRYVHSLIGRSIFIRYLEDRHILTGEYFRRVARRRRAWREILGTPPRTRHADPEMASRLYFRVLADKEFTYALFQELASDFNGDIFPDIAEEKLHVTEAHLARLQGLLRGDTDLAGRKLFFFAYKFNVIPIELISSIYEEFYNTERDGVANHGTHYTPPSLVEFTLSQTLTPACLRQTPRVLDPACGSGIFLVEAFRRMVRLRRAAQPGQRLSWHELLGILERQIAGIDINPEAIQVAAFSLYLAFLHYQEPPDILKQLSLGHRLPSLVYRGRRNRAGEQHLDILLPANAFDVECEISPANANTLAAFSSACADVVVGNPPWGSPAKDDPDGRKAMKTALAWCRSRNPPLSVGDREWSQAFVHRAVDLLRGGGQAALLVSTGVFFKRHRKSKAFRHQWLNAATLVSVVNFAHVRDVFFRGKARKRGALSPFASVVMTKGAPESAEHTFAYWSAKKTAMVEGMQAVILSRPDLAFLRQCDAVSDDRLWKVYWWGSHRDEALIRALDLNTPFSELTIRGCSFATHDFGRGFETEAGDPDGTLQSYDFLPIECFRRYGPIDSSELGSVASELAPSAGAPQRRIRRVGRTSLYEGWRLLIKRGIDSRGPDRGRLVARLASQGFCFRHSIYGVRLPTGANWEGKLLLGILWSSLSSYYLWLTSGSWVWHDDFRLEEGLKSLPICMPEHEELAEPIIAIVDHLRAAGVSPGSSGGLFGAQARKRTSPDLGDLEQRLDEAVFDLYRLAPEERDLVRDMCGLGLDLYYNKAKSGALGPVPLSPDDRRAGMSVHLSPGGDASLHPLGTYLRGFLDLWNQEMGDVGGEFGWQIICPDRRTPMLAVVFETCYRDHLPSGAGPSYAGEWEGLLENLAEAGLLPFGTSPIYIDGLVRVLRDTEIVIIKRNERRLWTASAGRSDAEATMARAMSVQDETRGIPS